MKQHIKKFYINVKKRYIKTIIYLTIFFASICIANLANAAMVRTIFVHGNQKISSQNIIQHLGISTNKEFSNSDVDAAVKNIFAMGYFSDVHVKQNGHILNVAVREYNLVNQIFFEGNKKIKSDVLKKIILLKPAKAFNATTLDADTKTIKNAYKSAGLNDVTVTSHTVDAGSDSVNVVFHIEETKAPIVKHISFEGNNSFGESRLRTVIYTKETDLLSWFTKDDIYSAERLSVDEEALKNFYFNHGYADFRVISSQATIEPGTNKYDVIFVVSEGAKYKFGTINIESSISNVDPDPLYAKLKTKADNEYNKDEIDDSIASINDKIASDGYAFARVEAHTDHDFANHTISINYSINQGPHLYVERIDIKGNDRTKDYVIRREFTFGEGDALNATSVRRVKRRLENLGFFKSVDMTTQRGTTPDQIILVTNVSENSTGEFSIGGGYTTGGSTPGASFDASIAENNFMGKGQYVRFGASLGQDSAKNFNFSFTEPYFLGHRLPAGIDIFHTNYRMNKAYDVMEMGASPRIDVPLTDNLTANITYNLINENYNLDKDTSLDDLRKRYAGAVVSASAKKWIRSSLQYGLVYNSLDNMTMPRQGVYAKAAQEFAGLGGNAKYLKTFGKIMSYTSLSDQHDIVGLLSGGAGIIHEKDEGARIFDLFKNDNNLIRGFKYNGIGPRENSGDGTTYFIGGTKFFNATAELQYPLPIISDTLGMRGAVFIDAGSVFDNRYHPGKDEEAVTHNKMVLRSSVGLSLIWASPLGPLRFDYAKPIKKDTGDLIQSFNFGVSSKF